MVFWKLIYFWTWLVIPKFVLCDYFYDIGKDLYDKAKLKDDDASKKIYKSECKKGVQRYFEAVYYGGGPDNLPYPYFGSYQKK